MQKTTMTPKVIWFSYWTDKLPPDWPVLDCRVIDNPYSKHKTDAARFDAIRNHPYFNVLVAHGVAKYKKYGKVACGCDFGRHRSRVVAEEIGRIVSEKAEKWYQFPMDGGPNRV